jgi:hypothetical protein
MKFSDDVWSVRKYLISGNFYFAEVGLLIVHIWGAVWYSVNETFGCTLFTTI